MKGGRDQEMLETSRHVMSWRLMRLGPYCVLVDDTETMSYTSPVAPSTAPYTVTAALGAAAVRVTDGAAYAITSLRTVSVMTSPATFGSESRVNVTVVG
jgi:hypothetical protein